MSENTMIVGGWNVKPIVLQNGEFPVGFDCSFMQALDGLDGAGYVPLVYCGSQLVHGTNHMIICEQTLSTLHRTKHVVQIVINQCLPTESEAPTILSIETLV